MPLNWRASYPGILWNPRIYRGVMDISQANRDEIEARYPKVIRRVSGYNLEDFLWGWAGEHGTDGGRFGGNSLCTVTEAKINLVPRPVMRGLAVVHFQDLGTRLRSHHSHPRTRPLGCRTCGPHDA